MKNRNKNARSPLQERVLVGAKKMPVVDTDGRFKTKNKKHDTKIENILNVEIINLNVENFNRSRLFIECA